MGTGSYLATPVIRDVGAKGLSAISAEIAAFEDTLFDEQQPTTGEDVKNATGTFSIHNLGTNELIVLLYYMCS